MKPQFSQSYAALLRGVNVGGHKQVAMSDLRGLLSDLGFGGVQSLLQSGNLVFNGPSRPTAELERQLEREAAARLKLDLAVLIRNRDAWSKIVAQNPFADQAAADPSHVMVLCLRDAPPAQRLDALRAVVVGREVFDAVGTELYLVYPDGVGRSRLTHALIEKTLATRGTARNWNTVLKIAKALGLDLAGRTVSG